MIRDLGKKAKVWAPRSGDTAWGGKSLSCSGWDGRDEKIKEIGTAGWHFVVFPFHWGYISNRVSSILLYNLSMPAFRSQTLTSSLVCSRDTNVHSVSTTDTAGLRKYFSFIKRCLCNSGTVPKNHHPTGQQTLFHGLENTFGEELGP